MAKDPNTVDPIHQFEIYPYIDLHVGDLDFSFTNSSMFMVIAVGLASLLMIGSTRRRGLVPNRMQSLAEVIYEFVAGTLRNTAGTDGMRFFPFVFSLFIFVLFANLLGMFPYFFTVTSHIIVTLALALLVISTVIIYGVMKHGAGFLGLFVPHGVPGVLVPFICFIEVLSFLARPVSLSLRLFGNMLAGHIVLKVFAGFIVTLGSLGVAGMLGAVLPFVMVVALTAFEFLVAFLQAYVFTILTCVYLKDALHPQH